MAHAGGRPTKLDDGVLEIAWAYMDLESITEGEELPTIEGLALSLNISRDTIYEWEKIPTDFNVPPNITPEDQKKWEEECKIVRLRHKQFSDIVSKLRASQAQKLIQKSLQGKYNPTIAKLILSGKHGYVEKSESDITSGGKPIPILGGISNVHSNNSPQKAAGTTQED